MSVSKDYKRSVKYRLIYGLVKSLIIISNGIPRKVWLKFCGVLGSLAYYVVKDARNLTLRHLQLAFPEKSASAIKTLAKGTFKMLGKNSGELLRSTQIETLEDLEKILITTGMENYAEAHARGKGVIFLTCHLGAFDLQVTNMAMRGLNPNIIGTPLKDKRLNDLLWQYRNMHGAIAIERGRETFRMIKILKSGGSVALLIDQDTKVKTRFVDFFGMPASTPVGATIFALKTGAAVVPCYIYLGGDGMQHMQILPEVPMKITGDDEVDMVYNTQVLTTFIENVIRQHPEQWVWMHERWRTKEGEEMT